MYMRSIIMQSHISQRVSSSTLKLSFIIIIKDFQAHINFRRLSSRERKKNVLKRFQDGSYEGKTEHRRFLQPVIDEETKFQTVQILRQTTGRSI